MASGSASLSMPPALERRLKFNGPALFSYDARITIHIGPLIAGVVGRRKFTYYVWGDALPRPAS